LKNRLAIAALFSAAACWMPAHAATILSDPSTNLPTGSLGTTAELILSPSDGYILAGGWDGVFTGANPAPPNFKAPGAAPEKLIVQTDLGGVAGLGLANTNVGQDNGFIAPTDAIILDFSHVTDPFDTITFNLFEDYSGADYVIYGTNATLNPNDTLTAGATFTEVTSGQMHNDLPLTFTTSPQFTTYVIGVTDCALDIESVSVAAPEPGTFVMAGMALIALGLTMKRRNKKF
jgi:hypothetical protein